MQRFTATIHQFKENGEKTGWTYIEVPADIAEILKPGNRKSFRVKGKLDAFPINAVALMPMRSGNFIMPLNAAMRKGIRKKKGGMVDVQLAADNSLLAIPPEFLDCLEDEPEARAFFDQLLPSHRNYYIKWIGGVKSETAVAKRIAQAVTALANKMDFGMMRRSQIADREKGLYK